MYLVDFFKGTRVAITGAAGSVGTELVRQLLTLDAAQILALDNDENGLFHLGNVYRADQRVVVRYCDVASDRLSAATFGGCDYVFHAAALKHVPVCEATPLGAFDVNVRGLINVMEAALGARVRRVIFTSSDKAVNPTNVMGASKLFGERIASSLNLRNGVTRISCTRFGNVAGSRGSVIPLFSDQLLQGESITLTHREMTRFFMTLQESVHLVIDSMVHANGGETFVTKMATIRIQDLAEVMADTLAPGGDVQIVTVGPRAGEKLYEELTTEEEQARAFEVGPYLIVQPPSLRHSLPDEIEYPLLGAATRTTRAYNTRHEPCLSRDQIRAFLLTNRLIPQSGLVEREQEIPLGEVA